LTKCVAGGGGGGSQYTEEQRFSQIDYSQATRLEP
jgi:hypothetical protein